MPAANLVPLDLSTLVELGPWRLVHWWLAVTALGAAAWVTFGGQHRRQWADHDLAWWLWHWHTGGRLETGRSIPDDARSTVARVGRRVVLGAVRTAVPAGLVAVEYVRGGAPGGRGAGTVAAAAAVGTVVLAAVTWAVVRAAVGVAHHLQWMRPTHRAVHRLAGWPETKRPSSYITVPRNRAVGGDGVVVRMPPDFDGRQARKTAIVDIVTSKLDLRDVSHTWVLTGRHSYVQFRPREQMPQKAPFTDPAVRALVEKAEPSAPIMGITRGHKPVAVDLDTEAPHVLVSAGTGGGKSTMIRTITAQLMWHGARVVVIDAKRHSHSWLRPLPGVTYARDIGEIHRTLVELAEEGHRRNRALDDVDEGQAPTFGRLVVVCEELNATMGMLKMWWRDQRTGSDPLTSPAITGLGQLLFMGRAVRIHVLAVAQLATAKDLGGPEMRENFAVRVLARYTANAAKMLVPECNLPATSRHPGRAQVCIGGLAHETQVIWMTDEEAQGWVADKRGRKPSGPHGDVASVATSDTPVSQGKQPATVATLANDGVTGLTLLEASRDRGLGVVELRHDALRQARRRDPEFPSPIGHRGQAGLYSPAALQRWEANRPRAAGADTAPVDGADRTDEVRPMEAGREI